MQSFCIIPSHQKKEDALALMHPAMPFYIAVRISKNSRLESTVHRFWKQISYDLPFIPTHVVK